MKNLNLNAYGVQEMNAVEMQETDGGHPVAWLVLGILLNIAIDLDAAAEDFEAGRQAARDWFGS